MSYRSDLEYMKKLYEERKKRVSLLLKISLLTLAALIVITLVAVIVTAATGGFDGSKPSTADDLEAPVITGPDGGVAFVYLGESISYKSLVSVRDDDEDVALSVDNSAVDTTKEGTYSVRYTATDSSGNSASYTLRLVIRKQEYSMDTLMSLVESRAASLGMNKNMSKTELVRRIYDYVKDPSASASNANIYFSDVSNTPAQQISRETWEIDWVEEACRTLTMSRMKGDCYSYYAVSKAFFEYFDIENVGIQRSASATEAGTHFWNVVNVGTKSAPKWYFYDATRLAGTFTSDGTSDSCLITEAKLLSYIGSNGETQFYLFDKYNGFPQIETQPLS